MIVSEKFPYGAGWINALTCGTGSTPIVMVHGADRKLQNAEHWRQFLTDTLPGKKFFALDLPGHGDSEPGELSPVAPTFEDKVRTVIHFVRNVCESEKVILVGRSLGGRIVLSAAATDPIVCKNVAAFVLIAPAIDEKFVFALPQSVLLKKTLLFWADDDPFVPATNSKFLLSEMEVTPHTHTHTHTHVLFICVCIYVCLFVCLFVCVYVFFIGLPVQELWEGS